MTLREFQQLIRDMYHDKDAARGVEGTFMWLTEEIGELATALQWLARRKGPRIRRRSGMVGNHRQCS